MGCPSHLSLSSFLNSTYISRYRILPSSTPTTIVFLPLISLSILPTSVSRPWLIHQTRLSCFISKPTSLTLKPFSLYNCLFRSCIVGLTKWGKPSHVFMLRPWGHLTKETKFLNGLKPTVDSSLGMWIAVSLILLHHLMHGRTMLKQVRALLSPIRSGVFILIQHLPSFSAKGQGAGHCEDCHIWLAWRLTSTKVQTTQIWGTLSLGKPIRS